MIILLTALLFSLSIHAAEPEPAAKAVDAIPTYITPEALKAILKHKKTITIQLSEEEAIALATAHGIKLKPRVKDDPAYGRPWVVVKLGIGAPSMINAMVEVYINDAWSIQPHVNLGLIYSATLIEGRYHTEKLCWNCHERLEYSLVPGIAAGYRNNTDVFNDGKSGVMVAGSMDAVVTYHIMEHWLITAGLKLSAGVFRENSGYTTTTNAPASQTDPLPEITKTPYQAEYQFTGDALFYLGVGF